MVMSDSILIVDDQPENISLLVEVLQGTYALQVARDGATALELAGSEMPPDIILLDVMMPGMDGYEVCRRLKGDAATWGIPVIFITALNEPEDETLGFRLGASDFISKPISPAVVQARVRAHLQLKRAKELLESQNEALEERVRERTAEVVRVQKERVASLNHFADALAHQIRNPIMSIGGMAGLLIKKAPADSPLIEYAEAVREGGLRLERLVKVVSEYVALSAYGIQAVSVKNLTEQAVAKAREIAETGGFVLDCSLDLENAMLGVDVRIVVLAIVEMAANAMEFHSGPATRLTIRGGVGRFGDVLSLPEQAGVGGHWYGVQIVDDGPGIPEDVLPYVTDPFFTTKTQGVGIGLTKVKRIICDEHGGTLLIRSPAAGGGGTEITFDLPLA